MTEVPIAHHERDAVSFLRDYSVLQERLVTHFLTLYCPRDLERFRDVPDSALIVCGEEWRHRRHGRGVAFKHADGRVVNAHSGMAGSANALDPGRVFEFAASVGIHGLDYSGTRFATSYSGIRRLFWVLITDGWLVRAEYTPGRFSGLYTLRDA